MLTEHEIADIDRRIQRAGAANCWTGTNGSLAADARRLVRHIQETRTVCNTRHYLGDEMATDNACILTEDDVADLADETRKAADIGGSVVPQPETAERMIPSQAEPWKHVPADYQAWCEKSKERARVEGQTVPTAAVRLLDTARAAVIDRHATYGPPMQHFGRTVGMVNSLFADVLKRPLTVADWARIMLLDKLARDLGPKPHADNAVDLAGYAACLAECQSAPPAAR